MPRGINDNEGRLGRGKIAVGYINILGAVSIAAMSYFTAPLGVRAAHALNAVMLKRAFGIYLLVTSAMMLHEGLS
jgi:uncharacterized membrane protein YfcA